MSSWDNHAVAFKLYEIAAEALEEFTTMRSLRIELSEMHRSKHPFQVVLAGGSELCKLKVALGS